MSTQRITIGVPADGEGYVSLQCHQCSGDFKLLAADVENLGATELWCPYCGIRNTSDQFIPPDVMERMQVEATNLAIRELNKSLGQLSSRFKGGGLLKITTNKLPLKAVPKLRAITDLAIVDASCCEKRFKVAFATGATLFYCPYCGQVRD